MREIGHIVERLWRGRRTCSHLIERPVSGFCLRERDPLPVGRPRWRVGAVDRSALSPVTSTGGPPASAATHMAAPELVTCSNAIFCPSGENAGNRKVWVTWFGGKSAAVTSGRSHAVPLRSQISVGPLRSVTNAYSGLVGDQPGSNSLRLVARRGRRGCHREALPASRSSCPPCCRRYGALQVKPLVRSRVRRQP